MKKQLPFCPYCKKRLGYLEAWKIHKDGEYVCSRCKEASNIRYTRRLRTFALIACILGLIISIFFIIFKNSIQLWQIFFLIIPFLLFFFLSPFTIVLSPSKNAGKNVLKTEGRKKIPVSPAPEPRKTYSDPMSERNRPPENTRETDYFSDLTSNDFYSSKYDFSLFEETREIERKPHITSNQRRRAPAKRRVDPPKQEKGSEETIDEILQDFMDE